MRLIVKLVLAALLALLAVIFLGPMAPEGSFVADWSRDLRAALNVHWGFPYGLPSS